MTASFVLTYSFTVRLSLSVQPAYYIVSSLAALKKLLVAPLTCLCKERTNERTNGRRRSVRRSRTDARLVEEWKESERRTDGGRERQTEGESHASRQNDRPSSSHVLRVIHQEWIKNIKVPACARARVEPTSCEAAARGVSSASVRRSRSTLPGCPSSKRLAASPHLHNRVPTAPC